MVIRRKTGYVVFFARPCGPSAFLLSLAKTVFIRVVHVTQEQNEKKKLCFAVFASDLGRVAPINPFYLFARVT